MKKFMMFMICSSIILISGCDLFEQKVTLKLFHYKTEISTQLSVLTEAFQKKNPKISFEIEYVPYTEPYFLMQRFSEKKNVPDILMLEPYQVLSDFADKGYLTDLSKEKFNDKIFPQVVESISYNGGIYAFPFSLDGMGIFYHRDLFEKLGIQVPEKFSELKSAADLLKKNKITPFAVSIKDSWTLGYLFAMAHSASLGNDDTGIYEFIGLMNSGKGSFGNSNTGDIFNTLDFYKDNGGNGVVSKGWNEQTADFANTIDHHGEGGYKEVSTYQYAMMVQSLHSYLISKSINPALDAGLTAFPFTENENQTRLYAGVDSVFAISNLSDKNKIKAAKKFMNFMASEEGIKLIVEKLKVVPAMKGTDVSTLDTPFRDLYDAFASGKTTVESYRLWNSDAFEYSKQLLQDYYNYRTDRLKLIKVLDEKWKSSVKK